MQKIIIIVLLLVSLSVLGGCEGIDISQLSDEDLARISEKAVICNKPYIRVGIECCLDNDDNSICDKDERELTGEENNEEAQVNEKMEVKEKAVSEEPKTHIGEIDEEELTSTAVTEGRGETTTVEQVPATGTTASGGGGGGIVRAGEDAPEPNVHLMINGEPIVLMHDFPEITSEGLRAEVTNYGTNSITLYLYYNGSEHLDTLAEQETKTFALSGYAFEVTVDKINTGEAAGTDEKTPEEETGGGITEADLADYPYPFIAGGKFNGVIVIGDKAVAEEVIAASDIAISLQYIDETTTVSGSESQESVIIQKIEVGIAKLAIEVVGRESEQNIISIGNPCVNTVTYLIMGKPNNCLDGFEEGKGILQLFIKNGYVSLVVAGYTPKDTRAAAKILSNYMDYDLSGTKMEIDTNTTVLTKIE